MEATVINVPFNETQMFLLQAFAQIKSEEEKKDIFLKNITKYCNFKETTSQK